MPHGAFDPSGFRLSRAITALSTHCGQSLPANCWGTSTCAPLERSQSVEQMLRQRIKQLLGSRCQPAALEQAFAEKQPTITLSKATWPDNQQIVADDADLDDKRVLQCCDDNQPTAGTQQHANASLPGAPASNMPIHVKFEELASGRLIQPFEAEACQVKLSREACTSDGVQTSSAEQKFCKRLKVDPAAHAKAASLSCKQEEANISHDHADMNNTHRGSRHQRSTPQLPTLKFLTKQPLPKKRRFRRQHSASSSQSIDTAKSSFHDVAAAPEAPANTEQPQALRR